MLEKGNVNVTYTTSTEKVIDNKEKEESYSTEMYVDKDDVSDFDCQTEFYFVFFAYNQIN